MAATTKEGADFYESLDMAPSTLEKLRAAADLIQAAADSLKEAHDTMTETRADYDAVDGAVGDLANDVGNVAKQELHTA